MKSEKWKVKSGKWKVKRGKVERGKAEGIALSTFHLTLRCGDGREKRPHVLADQFLIEVPQTAIARILE